MASHVFYTFKHLLRIKINDLHLIGTEIPVPFFAPMTIDHLCNEALTVLSSKKAVIDLTGDFVIVGDLHGNLFDLIRLIIVHGSPPATKYLFLGDYVDRGSYSLEIVVLLVSMMALFPDSVFLLRGNHEIQTINSLYGFLNETMSSYGFSMIWQRFNEVFQSLPLCAIINNKVFCVHGGISPFIEKKEDLYNIHLPILEVEGIVEDLMWSDPSNKILNYVASDRGKGCEFGPKALKKFLQKVNCDRMIRAHQSIKDGVETMFNGLITTVFSSSSPLKSKETCKCGSLIIDSNNVLQKVVLEQINQPTRSQTKFRCIPVWIDKKDYASLLTKNVSIQEFQKSSKKPRRLSSSDATANSMFCFKRKPHPSAFLLIQKAKPASPEKKLKVPVLRNFS